MFYSGGRPLQNPLLTSPEPSSIRSSCFVVVVPSAELSRDLCEQIMNSNEFRIAAHSAIDESKRVLTHSLPGQGTNRIQ